MIDPQQSELGYCRNDALWPSQTRYRKPCVVVCARESAGSYYARHEPLL